MTHLLRSLMAALAVVVVTGGPAAASSDVPIAHAAAVCADYPNQAAAQRAADTVDADGDGIYCESLPCPCLKPGDDHGGASPSPAPSPDPKPSCSRPAAVQSISFSGTKYANIRRHALAAIK